MARQVCVRLHDIKYSENKKPSGQSILLYLPDLGIELPVWLDGHCPIEFIAQSLGENFLDGYLIAFAPGDGYARIHVVDLNLKDKQG